MENTETDVLSLDLLELSPGTPINAYIPRFALKECMGIKTFRYFRCMPSGIPRAGKAGNHKAVSVLASPHKFSKERKKPGQVLSYREKDRIYLSIKVF